MNRIVNYGSFLQAYALQKMLQQLDHETEFMDIGPQKKTYYKMYPNNPHYCKNILKAWIHKFLGHRETSTLMFSEQKNWRYYHTLYHSFPKWWEEHLHMKREDNLNCNYEAIVIGSDEVFNCTQESAWGTSMKWFGEGLNTRRLISYAASFGFTTWGRLESSHLQETVAKNLKNFHVLSVRDENSRSIVEQCGAYAATHLDPVLVYDYENITSRDKRLEKNLIIYTYPDRLKEKHIIDQIKTLAKKEGLTLVSIGSYYDWCKNPVLTPFQVLQYFRNAKYIVTDTFHGTVFSLKFATPFATLVRDSNRQKLGDLLSRLGQEEAAITDADNLEEVLHRQMPAEALKQRLLEERQKTMSYLKENLNA